MAQTGTALKPLIVAVIGSGPSGFYATEALFKSGLSVRIDMYERLPVPYGLVRSGVAPDHPKLKQAIQVYAGIAETPGFRFIGNVRVGHDVSMEALKSAYHAIIITCGAESDRRLGIPGEDLPGSHTATEFVGWYNGHPDYRHHQFDLSHETAVIFGQGNVAADVARILAKTVDELRHTDIAAHALEVLAGSRIREIQVIGRRGPAQAKFTSKELKEFGELHDAVPSIDPAELVLNPASEAELADKTNAGIRKVYELFTEFAARPVNGGDKRRVHFSFLKSPIELNGTERMQSVRLELNRLEGEPGNQAAVGTGQFITLETGLVFRSIGYKGKPLPGVPFDEKRGIIPNIDGRVTQEGTTLPQLFVSGWIKRGPTGIIGTNRADSVATVEALLTDLRNGSFDHLDPATAMGGAPPVHSGVRIVTYDDWKKIDEIEISRGVAAGKPREKLTAVSEILSLLD